MSRYDIHNIDMPEDEKQFGLMLARQLMEVERAGLVALLKEDLDNRKTWDEVLMRGLVATRVFVGALMSSIRMGSEGNQADEEIERCRISSIALLESTGGVDASVEVVLSELRAYEQTLQN
jgi:hypothetical protein